MFWLEMFRVVDSSGTLIGLSFLVLADERAAIFYFSCFMQRANSSCLVVIVSTIKKYQTKNTVFYKIGLINKKQKGIVYLLSLPELLESVFHLGIFILGNKEKAFDENC